jgi:hypothetical protein
MTDALRDAPRISPSLELSWPQICRVRVVFVTAGVEGMKATVAPTTKTISAAMPAKRTLVCVIPWVQRGSELILI